MVCLSTGRKYGEPWAGLDCEPARGKAELLRSATADDLAMGLTRRGPQPITSVLWIGSANIGPPVARINDSPITRRVYYSYFFRSAEEYQWGCSRPSPR